MQSRVLAELLQKKNLQPSIFEHGRISFEDPISAHVAEIFPAIYAVCYPGHKRTEGIARFYHGIQHVARVAFYIPIFANLYRKYKNEEALEMGSFDLKLTQLAALFHDAGREGDEKDEWDRDSALLCYFYFTLSLGMPPVIAKKYAEAIANKDADDSEHWLLDITDSQNPTWHLSDKPMEKTLIHKLIQNADCLDIIRARDHFDMQFADFFKDYASRDKQAFEEFAQLITEARSLIVYQGDGRHQKRVDLKKKYENEKAYDYILWLVDEHFDQHSIFFQLSTVDRLLPASDIKPSLIPHTEYKTGDVIDEKNIAAAWRDGQVYFRGNNTPTALREKKDREPETHAALEIRKVYRRLGVKTRTRKADFALKKHGNKKRSVTQGGNGADVFSTAGFMIFSPDINAFHQIQTKDFDTGWHKKNPPTDVALTAEQKRDALAAVHRKQKMGGDSRRFADNTILATHNESTLDITQFDGVYYTQDACFYNHYLLGSYYPPHRYTAPLLGEFLRREHQQKTGVELSLYECSSHHNFIRRTKFDDKQIIYMWTVLAEDYIKKLGHSKIFEKLIKADGNQLKIECLYQGSCKQKLEFVSADSNYSEDLRNTVTLSLSRALFTGLGKEFFNNKIKYPGDLTYFLYQFNPIHRQQFLEFLDDDFYHRCFSDAMKVINVINKMELTHAFYVLNRLQPAHLKSIFNDKASLMTLLYCKSDELINHVLAKLDKSILQWIFNTKEDIFQLVSQILNDRDAKDSNGLTKLIDRLDCKHVASVLQISPENDLAKLVKQLQSAQKDAHPHLAYYLILLTGQQGLFKQINRFGQLFEMLSIIPEKEYVKFFGTFLGVDHVKQLIKFKDQLVYIIRYLKNLPDEFVVSVLELCKGKNWFADLKEVAELFSHLEKNEKRGSELCFQFLTQILDDESLKTIFTHVDDFRHLVEIIESLGAAANSENASDCYRRIFQIEEIRNLVTDVGGFSRLESYMQYLPDAFFRQYLVKDSSSDVVRKLGFFARCNGSVGNGAHMVNPDISRRFQ